MGKGSGAGRSIDVKPPKKFQTAIERIIETVKKAERGFKRTGFSRQEQRAWEELIERAIKYNRIEDSPTGSSYTPMIDRLKFTPDADVETVYHEFGHFLDYVHLTGSSINSNRISKVADDYFAQSNKAMKKAFSDDLKNLAKEIGFKVNKTGTNITGSRPENFVKLQQWWDRKNFGTNMGALSDIVSAMTKEQSGSMYVGGGHYESYWNRDKENRTVEVFAEYMAMRQTGNSRGLAEFKKLTPNLYAIMQKRYKSIWKGKKK